MDGACVDLGLICAPSLPDGECPFGERCVQGECWSDAQVCSAANTIGVCPDGQYCNLGVCTSRGECSAGNPTGECAPGEQCFEATCTPNGDVCGPDNPNDGACVGGLACLEGVCHRQEALCSPEQRLGRCPSGETCAGGECMAQEVACGPANVQGVCASGTACVDGLCLSDADLCGPDNPRGYCSVGLSCLGGACVEQTEACSYDIPDGLCGPGQICAAGHCQGPADPCNATTVWGACPSGQTCLCDAHINGGGACGTCGICSDAYLPSSASQDQRVAVERTNALRNAIGLWSIAEDPEINDAAQGHADYLVNVSPSHAHVQQDSGSRHFTGAQFWERMENAGYGGSPMSEVISYTGSAERSVDELVATVYHRIPFFDPLALEMGFGGATGPQGSAEVINFGRADSLCREPVLVVWPPAGADDVPTSWDGRENPTPPAPPEGYPSGPIISMHGSDWITLETHAVLLGSNAIDHTLLTAETDPNGSVGPNQVFLYTHRPLRSKTTYTVLLTGEHAGEPFYMRWSFTTE